MTDAPLLVHGLDLSYFTGKIEGYLRAKGIAYALREMDMAAFRRAGAATGVLQMPQIERPDGTWLTDSPRIIDTLEAERPAPSVTPTDPAARLLAHVLEDYFDEWLWRPALYYRWAFSEDAALMSRRIAAGMLRDIPGPMFLKRHFMKARQRRHFLRRDGVTAETRGAVEALYLETLDALEAVFAARPFVLGERPTRADFGLFGSMFRHFSVDPTPARILRARAPHVLEWTARVWALTPERFEAASLPEGAPGDMAEIAARVSGAFLPYCAANAAAFTAEEATVRWRDGGADFSAPVNAYRVWRFARLQAIWRAAPPEARETVGAWLGAAGAEVLDGPRPARIPGHPGGAPLDRTWAA